MTLSLSALASDQHMLPQNKDPQSAVDSDFFEQQVASGMVAVGTVLSDEDRASSEALSDYARAQASSAITSNAEAWLSKFGTASVQLSLEKEGKLGDSSADWLVPLYDTPENLLFTQLGMRHKDDRNTVNVGFGSRFFLANNWMLGLNSFIDSDITGHNYRLGFGVEAWADYLKLSANAYRRLSGWHQSRDVEDYDERPADGFDLRMNGFLPAYPQLGGTLVYEQYFGNEVALFGRDNRQKDPYAVTVGANYTPIPMLTFSAEQRVGKGDQNELNLALNLTWQLDKSLRENLSPESVDGMRKLSHSRYDLVERNNDIVLEYRKQQVIRLSLTPQEISGQQSSQQPVAATVTAKHGLKKLQWQGVAFLAAGGKITTLDTTHYMLTLPAWKVAQLSQAAGKKRTGQSDASQLLNTYVLTAIAEDSNGNLSPASQVKVEVLPPVTRFESEAVVEGDYAPSDGVTPVHVKYVVVDNSDKPVKGENVGFSVTFADGSSASGQIDTDHIGEVMLPVTSTVPGEAHVSARLNNGDQQDVSIHYVGSQPDIASSSLTASPQTVVANGKEQSTILLKLRDDKKRPIVALKGVGFTLSGISNTTLSSITETQPGDYVATVSGTVAGTVTIIPMLEGKPLSGLSAQVSLTSDSGSAHIAPGDMVVTTDNALADGVAKNRLSVKVTDKQGNPVGGQLVYFSADNGAKMATSGTTDANGMLSMTITSLTAGSVNVMATVNKLSQNIGMTFTADDSSAEIVAGNLTVLNDGAKADGAAANQVQVKVTDAQGNPLPGMSVNFTASNGAKMAASGTTGSDGSVQLPITSITAGISMVTASVNGSSQSVELTFVADSDTAVLSAGTLKVINNNALANGLQTNIVQARVVDFHGNPVAGQRVNFTASNGAAIAASAVSDSEGAVQLPVTSKTSGISTVSATLNGESQNVEVNFTPDGSTAEIGSGALGVIANNAVANGAAANRVQVKVTDANGNALTGAVVSFSASNGATIAATAATGADGTVVLPITSMTAGTSTITATVNSSQQKVDVTFSADSSSAKLAAGALTVTTDNAVANGSAANQIQVVVTDAGGNPVANQSVSFSASNGATVAASTTTDTAGRIQLPVTSKKAGISALTAEVNGSTQTVNLHFTADSSTAQITAGDLSVVSNNAVANGESVNLIKVRVTDSNGNPVPDQTVSFSATHGASIPGSGKTGSDGTLQMEASSTSAGTSTVKATLNGSSQSVDVTFVADDSTAQIASGDLTVTADNAVADGSSDNQVHVKVTDVNGNPVSGQTVSFKAGNGAQISASGNTATDGTLTMKVVSLKAGTSKVTATINGNSKSVNVTFVADAATAEILSGNMTITANNAAADASSANGIRVVVTDANGNLIAGQKVNFSASNGAVIAAQGVTDSSGALEEAITSTSASDSVIEADVNGHKQSVTVTFLADGDSAHFAVSSLVILANNAPANGVATNQLEATVVDKFDNPISGLVVSLRASNGATINSQSTTDANGKIRATLSNTSAGITTVTATVNGGDHSADVMFVADNSTATLDQSDLTVVTDNAIANGIEANQVQVKVTDANGNVVSGESVSFSATNGATMASSGTTDSDGIVVMPLTSLKAGGSTVSATVNGTTRTVATTFITDASTAEIASGKLTLIADKAAANGSVPNGVKAVVTDKNGNLVANQTVNFSATNGATIAATGVTDSNGSIIMPVTSLTAGVSTITAEINGSSQSIDVSFVADSSTAEITAGELTVVSDNAVANGKAANQVKVRVTDANGNPLAGVSVDFSADNGAVMGRPGVTDSNGEYTVTFSSTVAGKSNVTASINGSSQSVEMTFVADSSTAAISGADFLLLNDNAKANGSEPDMVQVTVKDASGNPVPEQSVSFSADNSAVVVASGATDDKGIVTVPVTSTLAGSSNITASTNGSTQSLVASFVADSTTAKIEASDIVVTQNGALSDGVAQNWVQARVTDTYSNVVGGVAVAFSATNGASVTASATTNTSGVVTVPVTSTKSGVSLVTGTINGSSPGVDVTFIAATVPVITDVQDNAGSVTGALVSGQVTDDTLPVLSGTADKNATIRLFNNGTLVGTSTADAEGLWSITPDSALSGEGNHTLTVTGALTPTGEQSEASAGFILNLDTVAQLPTIDRVTDSGGSVAHNGTTNGDSVKLYGTSEPNAEVTVYIRRVADRIQGTYGPVLADDNGNWQFSVTDMRTFQDTGEYQFLAKTTDPAGNSSKSSDMDLFSINYQSWPAPVGTPGYTVSGDGEIVDQSQVTSLLSSTGNALLTVVASGGHTPLINLPTASAANQGQRVYISVGSGTSVGLKQGSNAVTLNSGSQSTWYSTGSTWKQIY